MPTVEVTEPTVACCWMSLIHCWWSMPALAGAAKPNRAAAKPVAVIPAMVANTDFFMMIPLLCVSLMF